MLITVTSSSLAIASGLLTKTRRSDQSVKSRLLRQLYTVFTSAKASHSHPSSSSPNGRSNISSKFPSTANGYAWSTQNWVSVQHMLPSTASSSSAPLGCALRTYATGDALMMLAAWRCTIRMFTALMPSERQDVRRKSHRLWSDLNRSLLLEVAASEYQSKGTTKFLS